jgi:hypothetical protein
MTPSFAGPAPSEARKAGKTQYAISLAVSLKKDVSPKAWRLRFVPRSFSTWRWRTKEFYHGVTIKGFAEDCGLL